MSQSFFYREQVSTAFVLLNTKKCVACWECINVCINRVIGRINLPWHKHVRFINESACTGCMKCVKICKTSALTKFIKE